MTVAELKKKLEKRRQLRNLLDKSYFEIYNSESECPDNLNDNLKEYDSLKNKVADLNEWYNNFINDVSADDEYISNIIHLRYSRGFSWDRISYALGGMASESCYRIAMNRYLEKYCRRNQH